MDSNTKIALGRAIDGGAPYHTTVGEMATAVSPLLVGQQIPGIPQFSTDASGNVAGLANPKGGTFPLTAISRVLQSMRASIAQAKGRNSSEVAPFAPAPTWAVSTAYLGGETVRGTGSDANHIYLCVGTTSAFGGASGTSASSGTGPSGTGSTVISDGTCCWIPMGLATAISAVPLYNTTTLTNSASLMDGCITCITATVATSLGLTQNQNITPINPYYLTGGNSFTQYSSSTVSVPPNDGTQASPIFTHTSILRNCASIETNARKWIALQPAGPTYAKTQPGQIIAIEVNGQMLSESAISNPGVLVNPGMYLLNMSIFPEGKKIIRVWFTQNTRDTLTYAVWLAADDFAYPPVNPNRWRLAYEGDSITQTGFVGGIDPSNWIEKLVATQLGCDTYYCNAIGGTGATSDNSGTRTTYIQRLSEIITFNPDLLIIGGFHNDSAKPEV